MALKANSSVDIEKIENGYIASWSEESEDKKDSSCGYGDRKQAFFSDLPQVFEKIASLGF